MKKDGKTEKATPKRRQDVRKKGQIARSTEVNSALIVLAVFVALKSLGQSVVNDLSELMRFFLQSPMSYSISEKSVSILFLNLAIIFLKIVLPIALIALAVGVTASIAQTGFLLTSKPLVPDFKKLNPLSGISRLFSSRAVVDLVKSLIKITIVGFLAYSIIRSHYATMINTIDMDIWGMLSTFSSIAYEIGIKTGIALLILAFIDFFYQRYEFEKSIKMSKQEVKDEAKQSEGNPQIKSKIKRKQFEMAMNRMMQAIPTADVVITNPIRLAIALKYDAETMAVPKVVAKGQRLVAEKIRDIAKENNIPIVEDKILAQSLFKLVDIDQEVPHNLFKAVAEILAYVYRLNEGRPGQRR